MGDFIKALKSFRVSISIVSIIALLEEPHLASLFCTNRSAQNEIVNSIGSIGFFYGEPIVNNSGTRTLYLRNSESSANALTLFSGDINKKAHAILRQWPTMTPGVNGLRLLGLSPDEKSYAVAFNMRESLTSINLAVYDTDTGEELADMVSPNRVVTGFCWLTSARIVWSERDFLVPGGPTPSTRLNFAERQAGTWRMETVLTNLTDVASLLSLSDSAIAWIDPHGVYMLNLGSISNHGSALLESEDGVISGISFSRSSQKLLVTSHNKKTYFISSAVIKSNDALPTLTLLASDSYVTNAQWINSGMGFAYLNHGKLVVNNNYDKESKKLEAMSVNAFFGSPNGNTVVFTGACQNDIGLGLWCYDAKSQLLTNLVCCTDFPSTNTVSIKPTHFFRTNEMQIVNYFVYRPARFNPRKKYPVLLGDTLFRTYIYQGDWDGPSWAEAMANCGMYVIIVNRMNWYSDDNQWSNGVMTVYNQFSHDSTVDKRRVFLFGVSVETEYLSSLLRSTPGLWKGVVLMNPEGLPDLGFRSDEHVPKFLITAGANEPESGRFIKFQADACRRGISVEVIEHPDAGHVLVSIPSIRERIKTMASFVGNDY